MKNTKKKFIIVLSIFVLFILLFYIISISKHTSTTQTSSSSDSIIEVVPNISIEYPTTWLKEEGNNPGTYVYYSENQKKLINEDGFVPPPTLYIEILEDFSTITEYIKSIDNCFENKEKLRIGNYDAISYTFTCTRLHSIDVVFEVDDIIVRAVTYSNNDEFLLIKDTILPTFEFKNNP